MENVFVRTATTFLRLGDFCQAERCASEGLERLDNLHDNKDFWELRFVLAEVLRIRGRSEESLALLENEGFPPEHPPELRIAHDMHRGYCLGLLGRYQQSASLLDQAEKNAKTRGLRELQSQVLLREAMLSFLLRNYSDAEQTYRIALDLSTELDWYIKSTILAGLGKVLMIRGYYAEAIIWFEQSFRIVEEKHATYSMAGLWSELAVCELGLGHASKSLEFLHKALIINLELGALPSYQICVANIGNVYFQTGDYLNAISHYERALKIAREIKDPVSIEKWSFNRELAFSKLINQSLSAPKAV